MKKILLFITSIILLNTFSTSTTNAARYLRGDFVEMTLGGLISVNKNVMNGGIATDEKYLIEETFIVNKNITSHKMVLPVFIQTRLNPYCYLLHIANTIRD